MLIPLGRLKSYAWDKLGSCSFCVRSSFRAAAAGWGVAVVAAHFLGSTFFTLATVCAAALTALWLAHLLAYARRVTLAPNGQLQPQFAESRRAFFPLFIRTVCAMAVISAVPARADHIPCPGGSGACGAGGCPECSRPCYQGNAPLKCVKCYSCGGNCGEHRC